jgi:hypothetical protein
MTINIILIYNNLYFSHFFQNNIPNILLRNLFDFFYKKTKNYLFFFFLMMGKARKEKDYKIITRGVETPITASKDNRSKLVGGVLKYEKPCIKHPN